MKNSTTAKMSVIILMITSPQAYAAVGLQVESIAYDPIAREQLLTSQKYDGELSEYGIPTSSKRTIGFEIVSSDNADAYVIPASYGYPVSLLGGGEYLNLSADLQYVNLEGPLGDKGGVGDSRIGAQYYLKQGTSIYSATADFKLPTGDEDDGLGTGSTDFGFSFGIRNRIDRLGFNASAGYIIRGDGKPNGFDVDYGNVVTLVAGAEFRVKPDFWVGADIAVAHTGTSEFTGGFKADGLQTIDFIPHAFYRLCEDMDATFNIFYPLSESVVKGDANGAKPDREMSLGFGLNARF